KVMIKVISALPHGDVQGSLPSMPKRRMADIMNQRQRLNQIFIQAEFRSNGARNLGDLNGVSKTVAKVVGVAARKYLGLVFQTAKGARMDDPITVPLKIVAIWMTRLGIAPSEALFRTQRVRRKHDDKSNPRELPKLHNWQN